MEIEIELFGTNLLIVGNYIPADEQTHDYEGCSSDFEIDIISLSNDNSRTDIQDLVYVHEAKIKELVIEKIEE